MVASLRAERSAVNERVVKAAWAPQPGPQTAALLCPIADILFGGARGGGKTSWLLGDWLTHAARHAPHGRGILFRRTYDELDEVKDQAAEIYGRIGATWSPSRHTWFMPFGGVLKLRYLRRDADAERYQGHQYNWAGIDEAGNFPSPDPINKIRATLRDKRGIPTRFPKTANPGGPGHAWLKRDYVDVAPPLTPYIDPSTGEARVFIPSRLQDNQILLRNDPGYINRLRGSGPAWLVQAWVAGDWNATPEGGIIKAEWLDRRYRLIPPEADIVVHSWDTAYKANQINDPSVCTVWHLGRASNGYYLRDVFRERLEYPALKRAVLRLAERDHPAAILIEDRASGQSLVQELRDATTLPVIPIEPHQDKETRMFAASAAFEAGLVNLPAAASWIIDYEIELTTFPLAAHDDQVDSTSQFLNWVRSWSSRIDSAAAGLTRTIADSMQASDPGDGYGSIGSTADLTGFD